MNQNFKRCVSETYNILKSEPYEGLPQALPKISKKISELYPDIKKWELDKLCVIVNQMLRSSQKRGKRAPGLLPIISSRELMPKIESSKSGGFHPMETKRDDLKDYSKSLREISSDRNFMASMAFRDVVDSFCKSAVDTKTSLEKGYSKLYNMHENEVRLAAKTRYDLANSIKLAYEGGNSFLHIYAALISASPNYSKIAGEVMKSCLAKMHENHMISKKEVDNFLRCDLSRIEQKVASDPIQVEKNKLVDSYIDFIKFSTNQNRIMRRMAEVKMALDSLEKKIEDVKSIKKTANIYRPSIVEGLPKTLALLTGLSLSAQAANSFVNKIISKKDEIEKKKHFGMLIQKFPELRNVENLREYFSLIVDLNPSYIDKYYHLKTIIMTLVDQNQVVTPDLAKSLSQGVRQDKGKGSTISDLLSVRKFEDEIESTKSLLF